MLTVFMKRDLANTVHCAASTLDTSPDQWTHPQESSYKLNFDSSINLFTEHVGFGVIVRDGAGAW